MTGKLALNLGDDYAFDPRRARAVAEGASTGTQFGVTPVGPYNSTHGPDFWFRRNPRNRSAVQVGFNIDSDDDPDIWRKLTRFLNNDGVDQAYRDDIDAQARALGWDGVS